MRKFGMLQIVLAIFVAWMVIACSGCGETWKGIQKDWSGLVEKDKEFQDKYW